ncbi:copper amine oxidase N-terminal domain-containing protein [Cohnella fermenti]|uniref:Copper amine oxidase N-terminal domain-containing protein n=1 Tax=Cohnella fermenti TaxID=2565925 RepID=A0A4S4C815_9BACL|nr:copper amine oxidase N-terminal domain-containing protein [Cohnella fermenti]THF83487.1 copper amine oxidase N-terminal domain-containing protein [Cohnella fermenti]
MRKFIALFTVLGMLIGLVGFTSSAGAATQETVPVHLKVGKFYILYTKYGAPIADDKERILIPLRMIEGLLGGQVNYVNKTKTATVQWLDHEFELTIASRTAKVDGVTVMMDTVPILKNGAMFLPVRLFLEPLGINYSWDQGNKLLSFNDERVIVGKPFKLFDGQDGNADGTDNKLILDSYKLVRSQTGLKVTLHAKNLSGTAIPEGTADINPLSYFADGSFSVDSYSRPTSAPIGEIAAYGSTEITRAYASSLEYLIAVARI